MPGPNETFTVIYDFEVTPCAFDVVHFVSMALGAFDASGIKSLRIVLVPDSKGSLTGDKKIHYSEENYRWRLRQIVLPAIQSFCPHASIHLLSRREEAKPFLSKKSNRIYPEGYRLKEPLARYSHRIFVQEPNVAIRRLYASEQAIEYVESWMHEFSGKRKVVTITLRDARYNTDRNCNTEAWLRFASNLNQEIYAPVFLRDTDRVLENDSRFDEFLTFDVACFNLELRTALYQSAHVNLMINNGPSSLSYLGNRVPYLYFKVLSNGAHAACLNQMAERSGFRPGRNWPGANDVELFIWEDDRFETIQRAFETLTRRIDRDPTLTAAQLLEKVDTAVADSDETAALDWSAIAVAFFQSNPDTWLKRIEILATCAREEEAYYQNEEALIRFDHPQSYILRIRFGISVQDVQALKRIFDRASILNLDGENLVRELIGGSQSKFTPIGRPDDETSTTDRPRTWIFGASLGGVRFLRKHREELDALGFLDNDPNKAGTLLEGLPVESTAILSKTHFDKIWIASHYAAEIYKQLIRKGIPFAMLEIAPREELIQD